MQKLDHKDNQLIERRTLQLQKRCPEELVDEVKSSDRHEPDRALRFRVKNKQGVSLWQKFPYAN